MMTTEPGQFSENELAICKELNERIARSSSTKPTTLRNLYGSADWDLIGQPVCVGLLVARLIAAGLLPLTDCGKDGRNHRVYRIQSK